MSINNFPTDTEKEIELIRELAVGAGAETVVVNRGVRRRRRGRRSSSRRRLSRRASGRTRSTSSRPDGTPLKEQIEAIATKIYGADGVDYLPQAEKDLARMEQLGFGEVPVCMAKTHLSLSHDPRC